MQSCCIVPVQRRKGLIYPFGATRFRAMPETTDEAENGGTRIAKFLARAGVASRREAERMVFDGRVAVNGGAISTPAVKVAEGDTVLLDGAPVQTAEVVRLWRYYKPAGLVTSTRDDAGRPTVFETLPDYLPRVVSVGRLDLNSEGLLLLTNSGSLKRHLELPSTGWLRNYRVRARGVPGRKALERLRAGIDVGGERFAPMDVDLDRTLGANAWLTVRIREGRNREIRRAFAKVGLAVNRLIRVSYGPFLLGDMAQGQVSEVRRRILRAQLGKDFPGGEFGATESRGRRQEAHR